jgi:phosphomannomutase
MNVENLPGAVISALDEAAAARLRQWWTDPAFAAVRPALGRLVSKVVSGDEEATADLADAFSRDLPIGTGGRRGPVGPGPNRMNEVVLRQTAAGVAEFVRTHDGDDRVVVVYDTRRDSRTFAHLVAGALAADGMEVVVLDEPRPTPQLSFEMRRRAAGAGIVISASHNPPGDNGIKIYASDGAQVLGEDDRALMMAIQAAATHALPPGVADPEAHSAVEMVRGEALARLDADYHAYVLGQGVLDGSLADVGLSVVYTPLHGVGGSAVLPVLRSRGLEVYPVEPQMDPDSGRFSTVKSANPESPASFELARALAVERDADLVLANDPDADRLGALARNASGELEFIDGNRLGVLMMDHVLRHGGPVPAGAYVCQTIVSSPMVASLAREAGVDVVDDILVGFKHHAGVAREREGRLLAFGFEESHGYLRGNEIRDKDGAIAALLLAECAVDCARDGSTLLDRLASLWARVGYHAERTRNLWARGAVGREAIAVAMKTWRADPPREIAGLDVRSIEDRREPRETGSVTRDLPGNVLIHELVGSDFGCRLVLRPSGTEPKLKVYALARGPRGGGRRADVDALVDSVLDDAEARARAIMAPLLES